MIFLLHELKEKLSDKIVGFPVGVGTLEDIAMCDEDVLENYMETGKIEKDTISELIYNRMLFPCFFGSALKLDGVEELIEGLYDYTFEPVYNENFGAKVYKISKDNKGNRLTHIKITGGELHVKDIIKASRGAKDWEEKVNELRLYSGDKYESVSKVQGGDVCVIPGFNETYSGQGLGFENESIEPSLVPVLAYKVITPKEINVNLAYKQLMELEDEDPTLKITWNEEKKEITANVMGPIQIEVLKQIVKERFNMDIEFGAASILYKETILDTVEGVGHFEPLKHYAEVHLMMEPGEPGTGLQFRSKLAKTYSHTS